VGERKIGREQGCREKERGGGGGVARRVIEGKEEREKGTENIGGRGGLKKGRERGGKGVKRARGTSREVMKSGDEEERDGMGEETWERR